MAVQLAQLAEQTGCELRGDPGLEVSGVATLSGASPGQLSFLSNPKYRKHLAETRATAVILSAEDADACPVAALVAADPYLAYARAAALLAPVHRAPAGVHATAVVADDAVIGDGVVIGPNAVVEAGARVGAGVTVGAGCFIGRGTIVGSDSVLHPRVTVMHGCTLGDRVIVHPGAVIGADGFGIAKDGDGWVKVPQLGGVRIGDDCEIGANTTIDRGALEDTVLEEGVKLDNQIMIAHNVHIGAHTVAAGCVGIAGSTTIGKRCMIAGAAGIGGHIDICDDVTIMAFSMVTSSIHQPGQYASGLPLDSLPNWRRNAARFRNLDDLAKRVKALEKKQE